MSNPQEQCSRCGSVAGATEAKRRRVAELREALIDATEFLEERFGNGAGNDWTDDEAAFVADLIETALAATDPDDEIGP